MLTTTITLISVGCATIWDLKTRKIPNLLTFSAILTGICVNTFYTGLNGMFGSIFGVVIGALILLLPFVIGGMGAGDVKLLAAVGAINGSQFVINTFLYSALVGGLIALIVASVKGRLFETILNTLIIFRNGIDRKNPPITSQIKFPYGISILAGTVATYLLR